MKREGPYRRAGASLWTCLLLGVLAFSRTLLFAQTDSLSSTASSLAFAESLLNGENEQTEKALADLRVLNLRYQIQEQLIREMRGDITAAEDEIELLQENHCRMGEQIESLKQEYRHQVLKTYRLYSEQGFWLSLLASDNLTQAYYRVVYFREYSRYRRQQILILQESRQILTQQSKQISQVQRRRRRLIRAQQKERAKLRDTNRLRQKLNLALRDKAKSLEADFRAQQNALVKLLEENRKESAPALAFLEEQELDSLFQLQRGQMPWPVPPEKSLLLESFGEVSDEFGNLRQHHGWTFRVAEKQMVSSVSNGKVSGVRIVPLLGTAVIISHGRYRTVYANLAATALQEGDYVKPGSAIGQARTDRRSGESLVRFMVYREPSDFLDPSDWLK
ncbi:MAG: M23 family metallopeptidase [Bacteroidota bacterium]